MDREEANRIAEMYKNAAEKEKDHIKAAKYYKKAANYYIKLGVVENTIKCLERINLVESNLEILIQNLDTEKVIEYFESNSQFRLFLLTSTMAIERELIDLKKFQTYINYYFDFNNILNLNIATNKERLEIISAILLIKTWYSVEINSSYELYFIDILSNERKANNFNNSLSLFELLLMLKDPLKYIDKTGEKLNIIRDILINNQMFPLQGEILRVLIPVLIFQNKDISLLVDFSKELKTREYIIKLSELINDYNFEGAIIFASQNQKMILVNSSTEKKINSFKDIIWKLINSPIYNPENLLINILKEKAGKLEAYSQELKEHYNKLFDIDDPIELLRHLEKLFEHQFINIFNDNIIQEILEKICLLAYDQEKFEKYDNYSSILENLYGVDINLVLKEIVESSDE